MFKWFINLFKTEYTDDLYSLDVETFLFEKYPNDFLNRKDRLEKFYVNIKYSHLFRSKAKRHDEREFYYGIRNYLNPDIVELYVHDRKFQYINHFELPLFILLTEKDLHRDDFNEDIENKLEDQE